MSSRAAIALAAVLVVAGVVVALVAVLGNDSTPSRSPRASASTDAGGTSGQDDGSAADLQQLQGDAESAAEQLASGDGLRVDNTTGERVSLVFPDGDTAWVAAGESAVVLKPCRERLPLRAERENGELIAERDGPCRRRDTWTLVD